MKLTSLQDLANAISLRNYLFNVLENASVPLPKDKEKRKKIENLPFQIDELIFENVIGILDDEKSKINAVIEKNSPITQTVVDNVSWLEQICKSVSVPNKQILKIVGNYILKKSDVENNNRLATIYGMLLDYVEANAEKLVKELSNDEFKELINFTSEKCVNMNIMDFEDMLYKFQERLLNQKIEPLIEPTKESKDIIVSSVVESKKSSKKQQKGLFKRVNSK